MSYQVKITEYAVEQLREIHRYISGTLQAPASAAQWMQRIRKEMASLNSFPNRFPLTPEEPWRTEGIRRMPVENFLVYYWVNTETATIWITAVIYGRRDQAMALRTMPEISE